MKQYRKLCVWFIFVVGIIIFGSNLAYQQVRHNRVDKKYKVDMNRLLYSIETEGVQNALQKEYRWISRIEIEKKQSLPFGEFIQTEQQQILRQVKDKSGQWLLVKISYITTKNQNSVIIMNVGLLLLGCVCFVVLYFIGTQVVQPFENISNLPFELAKGNLVVPLKQRKSRYFGKFLWGLDQLREKLSQADRERLELEREKKLLLLSISHDINTPVSSIRMAAKALQEDLYSDVKKQKEVERMIEKNALQVEAYVTQIKQAVTEDFLNFHIHMKDIYLKEIVEKVRTVYKEKCKLTKTKLTISEYENQLIRCDSDRIFEVFQNVLDNALKYGDGKAIMISFEEEENFRLVHIANSGVLPKEQEMVHLFDSFFRASNAGKKAGSGLGLYICKQLMNRMDGDIYATIENHCFVITVVMQLT